jgi:hypothetical protein
MSTLALRAVASGRWPRKIGMEPACETCVT